VRAKTHVAIRVAFIQTIFGKTKSLKP